MTRRGFVAPIILVGILLLLVVVGGAYYLRRSTLPASSPEPTQIALAKSTFVVPNITQWKLYVSSKNGYSFKYRPDLTVVDDPNGKDVWLKSPDDLAGKGEPDSEGSWFELRISVRDNPTSQTPRDYVNSVTDSFKREPGYKDNPSAHPIVDLRIKTVINSFKSYTNGQIHGIVGDIDGYESPNVTVIFAAKNKLLQFSLWGGPNTGTDVTETAKKTFDQILSTFKFTQ